MKKSSRILQLTNHLETGGGIIHQGSGKKRQGSGDKVSMNCTLNNAVVTLKKFRF